MPGGFEGIPDWVSPETRRRIIDEEMFLSILSELETPIDVENLYEIYESEAAPDQVSIYLSVLRNSKLAEVERREVDGKKRTIWRITDEGRKVSENPSKYEFPNPWDNPEGIIRLRNDF